MVALDEAFNVIKAPGQAMGGTPSIRPYPFNEQVSGAFGTVGDGRPPMADMAPQPDEKSPRQKADDAGQKAKDHGDSALHSFTTNPVTQAIVDEFKGKHREHGVLINDILNRLGPDAAQDMGMKEFSKLLEREKKEHERTQRLFNSSSPDVRHTPTREGAGSMPDDAF